MDYPIRKVEELRDMHAIASHEDEARRWNRRTDVAVDNIAHLLGLEQIPYGAPGREFDYRFLAAYRLELLEQAIQENGVSI